MFVLHLKGGLSGAYTLLQTSQWFGEVQFLNICEVLCNPQVKDTGENITGPV